MATHNVTGFSVSRAAILNGSTGAEEALGDLFGIRSASVAADIGNADLTGNDAVLASTYWFNKATITVTGGFIPFDAITLMTGTPVYDYVDAAAYTAGTFAATTADKTAAKASAGHIFEQELWTETSINSPMVPVLVEMPSQDSDGKVRLLYFVFYKVQWAPLNFTGPQYKTYLEVNTSGTAVMSTKDEAGQPIGTLSNGRPLRSVGRLISRPGV